MHACWRSRMLLMTIVCSRAHRHDVPNVTDTARAVLQYWQAHSGNFVIIRALLLTSTEHSEGTVARCTGDGTMAENLNAALQMP